MMDARDGKAKRRCFAYDGALITVAEAFEQIETRLAPVVEAENAPVRAAVGLVLAQDVVARMNLPPHANSAVGCVVNDLGIQADRAPVSHATIGQDLVVTSGGVSTGKEDHC
jgi:molybdopterin biosynthesis enzyme